MPKKNIRFVASTIAVATVLTACTPSNVQNVQGEINTVTANGRAYDVFYDPYTGDHAVIFGKRSIVMDDLPKAEIIAKGTPCVFDRNSMIVFRRSELVHPTRPDLDNLGWVPLDCPS